MSRSIQIKKTDLSDLDSVNKIARIHCGVPAEWDSNYSPGEWQEREVVEAICQRTDDRKVTVFAAVSDQQEIVGFHWIEYINGRTNSYGRIRSLWVHPEERNTGIGTKLKNFGEIWLRELGATVVKSQVYSDNKNMVDLNIKLGFRVEMVRMTKKI